jgi:hypothetical protein
MGFLADLSFGSIKGLMEGAGSLAKDLRSAFTGEISPEKKAELLAKADELEAMGMNAQAEINKIEAASPKLFVSGWRPFIGWVCGFGIGYQFVFRPLLIWIGDVVCTLAEVPLIARPPELDVGQLISLVLAMLGVAGYRTYEKIKKTARN